MYTTGLTFLFGAIIVNLATSFKYLFHGIVMANDTWRTLVDAVQSGWEEYGM